MHFLKLREKTGTLSGYALGLATGTLSFIRQSRMFHPRGLTYVGKVTPQSTLFDLPPQVLLRFSSAWWKQKEWRDVLGIALRFSHSAHFTEKPLAGDQDLLFATIQHPWTLPFAPFTTRFHDFLANHYFAVTPFSVGPKSARTYVEFRLRPLQASPAGRSRGNRLSAAVKQHAAEFALEYLNVDERAQGWQSCARIEVIAPIHLDQEALSFDPFRAGAGIHPRGWVHYLRIGAYRLSQFVRPRHHHR